MALVPASSPAGSLPPPTQDLQDAIVEFQKILTDDERSKLQGLKTIPDADAVLVFTAQLDSFSTRRKGPSIGTRLLTVLQFVRESSAIIDTFVSSHPEIAALVWGSVKLTIQVILNFASYYERISDLFMQFATDCPRFADYQVLYPTSVGLQKALCNFNASIIHCCKHVVEAAQRPWLKQVQIAFRQSFQQEFNPDLEQIRRCGAEVRQEIKLAKAKADHQDQNLQRMEGKAAANDRSKIKQILSRLGSDLNIVKEEQLQRAIRRAEGNRRRLFDSLSSYDYLTPYKKACKMRHCGTAEWHLNSAAFTRWENGTASPWLWCSGKIGSGKTILTASAIEHVYARKRKADEIVTFFFPQFDDTTSLSAEAALRSVIRQSLDPVRLTSQWEANLDELDRNPFSSLDQLRTLLRQKIDKSEVFYIFIDALDEFEPRERQALLDSLVQLSSKSCLRVFLASRESLSVELKHIIPALGVVSMTSVEARIDISLFVEETLRERQRSRDLVVEDQSIINEVKQALVNHADGMFLWVTFLIDEICAQHCDDDIRSAIGCLPKTLTDTFTRALQRITNRRHSSVAKNAFQWIAVAKRHLTLGELREAISIEVGQSCSRPGKMVNGIDQLPAWCENLIRVDEEMRTVEFAHQAIHKFIVEGLSGSHFPYFLFDLKQADHYAGEICVTYLGFSDFVTTVTQRIQPMKRVVPAEMAYLALKDKWKLPRSIGNNIATGQDEGGRTDKDFVGMLATYDRSDDAEAITQLQGDYPFLEYASIHWISHTSRFQRSNSTWNTWQQFVTQKHTLAKKPWSNQEGFMDPNSDVLAWSLKHHHFAVVRLLDSFDRIHVAQKKNSVNDSAAEGDVEMLNALLEKSCAAEITSSALRAASKGGHVEVVELLLRAGADVDECPRVGRQTALQVASERGHIEIVELLLRAGADANEYPRTGWTSLQVASEGGYREIVELLLRAEADVNASPSVGGRTALQAASECGHIEIVEILLREGANVNADPSAYGRTALQAASEGGHVEIVELLLSIGADVNADPSAWHGRTALQAASEGGHIEIVELLLGVGFNVNADPSRDHGRTALQAASEGGHIQIVELLLRAGANVNADPSWDNGRTALQAASEGGHVEIVELLLRIGADVNAGPSAWHGRTALQAASKSGHMEVVERLRAAGAL